MNPIKTTISELVKGDKFIIPSLGGMNTFDSIEECSGVTEYHYISNNGTKTISISNQTVYKFQHPTLTR